MHVYTVLHSPVSVARICLISSDSCGDKETANNKHKTDAQSAFLYTNRGVCICGNMLTFGSTCRAVNIGGI